MSRDRDADEITKKDILGSSRRLAFSIGQTWLWVGVEMNPRVRGYQLLSAVNLSVTRASATPVRLAN